MIRSLLVMLILLSAGCGSDSRASAPWKSISTKGPLSGPNESAVLESREYWSSIMAAGVSGDYRFKTANGRTTDATRLESRIVSFLEKKGHLSKWPDSQSSINSRTQKVAPYKIYIISIFPTVVLLSPHDYGELRGRRSNVDIVGWPPPESLQDSRILNHLFFGSSIEMTNSLFWFSPDLDIDITPASKSDTGSFIIDDPKIKMIGRPSGSLLEFERK